MKKVLFGLMAMACLFACKKEDKKEDTPPPQTDEWLLSKLVRDIDSTRFTYNADGTVKQFAQYSLIGGMTDSTRVLYTNNKVSKFILINADGTATRTDLQFTYSGEQLVRIDYYGYGNDNTWQMTDHDSLVYKDGKLTECHRLLGDFRSGYSKYTWENGNLVKDEHYAVINNQSTFEFYYTYTYSNKPNPYKGVKANFLFAFTRGNQTYLSDKEMTKWETVYMPSNVVSDRVTIAYTYDPVTNALQKTVASQEDLLNGGSQIVTSEYTFIKK